jgi:hypothetical protein
VQALCRSLQGYGSVTIILLKPCNYFPIDLYFNSAEFKSGGLYLLPLNIAITYHFYSGNPVFWEPFILPLFIFLFSLLLNHH